MAKKQDKKNRGAVTQEIRQLFDKAYISRNINPALAHKYMRQAYKLALKKRIKFSNAMKRRFCKRCLHYFISGKNYRVRMNGKTITYTCLDCRHQRRVKYKG